jgi:elongation factor 3
VRQAAEAALAAYIPTLNPYSVEDVLPTLFAGMAQAKPWQVKVGALQALEALSKSAPRQVARCLPDIVPKVRKRRGSG